VIEGLGTFNEVIERLGVPRTWFDRQVKAGLFPGIFLGNKKWFHLDTIKEIIVTRARTLNLQGKPIWPLPPTEKSLDDPDGDLTFADELLESE